MLSAPATVSAGSSFQASVTALDTYGNGVPNVPVTLGGMTVQTSDGSDGHAAGYADFGVTAPTAAGTYTLTASAPTLAPVTKAYTVVGAYPRWIDVVPSPSTPAAGAPSPAAARAGWCDGRMHSWPA